MKHFKFVLSISVEVKHVLLRKCGPVLSELMKAQNFHFPSFVENLLGNMLTKSFEPVDGCSRIHEIITMKKKTAHFHKQSMHA